MSNCPHSVNEKDTARIDGLCPLCLQAEVERLKRLLKKSVPLIEFGHYSNHSGMNKQRVKLLLDIEQALKG